MNNGKAEAAAFARDALAKSHLDRARSRLATAIEVDQSATPQTMAMTAAAVREARTNLDRCLQQADEAAAELRAYSEAEPRTASRGAR